MAVRTLVKAGRIVAVAAAGGATTVAVTAAGGKLAQDERIVEPARRLYDRCRQLRTARMSRRLEPVTLLGGYAVIQAFSVLVGAMLAHDRRRWAPLTLPVAGFVAEVVLQKQLQQLVKGSKPPAEWSVGDPGDYPSGGAARMVVTFGLLGHFLTDSWIEPSEQAAVWGSVVALVLAQGASRVYLGRHWPEDVVGGWLFGSLLLGTLLGVDRILRPAKE